MRSSRGRIWLNVTPPPRRRTSRGDGPRPHRTAAAMAARRNSRTSVDAAFRHHLCGVRGEGSMAILAPGCITPKQPDSSSRHPAPLFLALGEGGRCLAVRIDDQVSPRRHLGAPRSPAGAPKVTRSQCGGASTAGDARPGPLVGVDPARSVPGFGRQLPCDRRTASGGPSPVLDAVVGHGWMRRGSSQTLTDPERRGKRVERIRTSPYTPPLAHGLSARLGRAGAGMRWSAGCWQVGTAGRMGLRGRPVATRPGSWACRSGGRWTPRRRPGRSAR